MKGSRNILLLILPLVIVLTSCDAVVHISYSVENNTNKNIEIFVPDYTVDPMISREYSAKIDTVMTVEPNQTKVVGYGSKIDFPWARKRIYTYKPGICGIKRIDLDTMITFGCTKKEWNYQKGQSVLRVK